MAISLQGHSPPVNNDTRLPRVLRRCIYISNTRSVPFCDHFEPYSHRQMSIPKQVWPNMATATPLGLPGAQTAQEQHAGLLELDAQPSAARIGLPEGAARKISASVRRAHIPDTHAASGPRTGNLEGP